jgi:hypothetical protein
MTNRKEVLSRILHCQSHGCRSRTMVLRLPIVTVF